MDEDLCLSKEFDIVGWGSEAPVATAVCLLPLGHDGPCVPEILSLPTAEESE